jgi:hypothetical protein
MAEDWKGASRAGGWLCATAVRWHLLSCGRQPRQHGPRWRNTGADALAAVRIKIEHLPTANAVGERHAIMRLAGVHRNHVAGERLDLADATP